MGNGVIPRCFEKNMSCYDDNPVVLYGHNHSIPAVGKVVDYVFTDNDLKMKVKFAVDTGYPLAKLLWGLYSEEYMKMVSVGFIPLAWSDDEDDKLDGQRGLTFTSAELIELSLVNVGSNRYALSDMPKHIKGDTVMSDLYAMIIEEPDRLKEYPNSNTTKTTSEALSIGTPTEPHNIRVSEGTPINLSFVVPPMSDGRDDCMDTDKDQSTEQDETTDESVDATTEETTNESTDETVDTKTDDQDDSDDDSKEVDGALTKEEREAVHEDLTYYLDYMLSDKDLIDFTILHTTEDHVIVRCDSTGTLYKGDFVIENDEVNFTNLAEAQFVDVNPS